MKMYEVSTCFVGSEQEAIEYVNELSQLTNSKFTYQPGVDALSKNKDGSWLITATLDEQTIEQFDLVQDFIIN